MYNGVQISFTEGGRPGLPVWSECRGSECREFGRLCRIEVIKIYICIQSTFIDCIESIYFVIYL